MIPSLQDLPQEVLYQVLLYLPLDSVLAFEQVCNRFRDTSGPVVWRQLCKNSFQHWHTTHEFAKRLVLPVEQTNWKQLYAQRHKRRNQVQQGIDSILAQQSDRTAKIQDIVSLGWDAKDTLLHHCRIGDGQDDVLARRWYSRLVLGCLHRSISIEQWLKLDGFAEENGSLERALSAFDLFVAQEVDGNLSDVPAMLDAIAKDFEAKHPDCAQLAFQKKATVLAGYVQEHNLMGIDDDVDAHYHDLQNNFIRNALKHTHHPSLPLISVAIYCCIAQRLGLNARPCCFPFHVLAVIKSTDQDDVYLDPFRGPEEIKLSELKSKLESLSISPENHAKVLNAASTAEVVTRCARNIITAIQTIPQGHNGAQGSISPDSAFYGALWVLLLTSTTQGERHSVTQYAAYLPVVVNHMQTQFPSDVWLIEKYLVPQYEHIERGVSETLQAIRVEADAVKLTKPRTLAINTKVAYKIGQVFRHRRYQYHAVIIGWDLECAAPEQWMAQMRVHELPNGKHQSFYHVLVEDKSVRYVAQENIRIIQEDPLPNLLGIAGQYFKRWDPSIKAFISNICDEYPDD